MRLSQFFGRVSGRSLIFMASLTAASPALAQTSAVRLSEPEAVARALGDADFAGLLEARRAAAKAEAEAIGRFANPSVTARRGEVSGAGQDEVEWEVGLVQPLDVTRRRAAERDAAQAQAAVVDADMVWRVEQRRAEVRRAYTACGVAEAAADAKRGFVQRLTEVERIVSERTEAGDTAVYDLRRVRVEARTAAADAQLAVGETEAECLALGRLTGVTGARPTSSAIASAGAPGAIARADLLAGQRRVEAASSLTRAAERSRWPDIEVGLGWRRLETAGFQADGPQISVGATIPLFDRGAARVSAARARERAEAADLALARRAAETQVGVARVRARSAAEALRLAETSRADFSRLGAIAATAYASGETGVTELVDAYRAAHEAELSTIELTGRASLAAIELDLAQGGPTL